MIREVICFAVGAAAGFGAATLLMKNRYESMVEEETKSAMEWVKSKNEDEKPITHGEADKEIERLPYYYQAVEHRRAVRGSTTSKVTLGYCGCDLRNGASQKEACR